MSSNLRHTAARLAAALVISGAVMFALPLELPAGMDFSHIYLSSQSVVNGGSIYGLSVSQASADRSSALLTGALPYPGPPWSFPCVVALGLFAPSHAAAIWGVVSTVCLCLTVILALPDRSNVTRALIIVLALVSAPVQGHLVIGQTTIVALLGAALAISGQRDGSALTMGVGFFLLSFRPHLGLPVVLLSLIWLFFSERRQSLRSLASFLSLLAAFTVVALLIDPTCLTAYARYLRELNALPSNIVCDTCSSLPILLTGRSPEEVHAVWTERFLWSSGCFLVLGALLVRVRPQFPVLVGGALCITLISAPYNRNYDFALLVIPLVIVGFEAWRSRRVSRGGAACGLGLIATAGFVGGILPYGASRAAQGDLLVYSAAMGFLATVLVVGMQGAQERLLPVVGEPRPEV